MSVRQCCLSGLSIGEGDAEVVELGEGVETIRGGYDGGRQGPKAGLGLGRPGGISY